MSTPALYSLTAEYRALAMLLADGEFDPDAIATEAYRRGVQDGQKINAAVGAWLDQEPS